MEQTDGASFLVCVNPALALILVILNSAVKPVLMVLVLPEHSDGDSCAHLWGNLALGVYGWRLLLLKKGVFNFLPIVFPHSYLCLLSDRVFSGLVKEYLQVEPSREILREYVLLF